MLHSPFTRSLTPANLPCGRQNTLNGPPTVRRRERRSEAEEVARGLLPGTSVRPRKKPLRFLAHVEASWTPQSRYVREQAMIQKAYLSVGSMRNNHDAFVLHAVPFSKFKGVLLTDL